MKRNVLSFLVAVFGITACAKYSSVSEKPFTHRHQPITAAGAIIAKALRSTKERPETLLGGYLDAAAASEQKLRANPGDIPARDDYNFATARIFDVIHDFKLEPWKKPIAAIGAEGTWHFSLPADSRPEYNPANYDILPADRYQFHGSYVTRRIIKKGLGAPLILASKPGAVFTKTDRFTQGGHTYYGITALLRFKGRHCSVSYTDPLSSEHLRFAGRTFPLAADFTAPVALALARQNPKKLEIARFFHPIKYAETARLSRFQPYEPEKIPVVFVHGLLDSPATWMPLITALRADPAIRTRYQFWFYSYPSGYPYPYSAAIMRRQLDGMNKRYPDHKKIILIGHSMGGLISRTMITDSGEKIWNEIISKPPNRTRLSAGVKKILTTSLIFNHRPEVARVIFIAAPHRGSEIASSWLGRLGSRLIRSPRTLLGIGREVLNIATFDTTTLKLQRIPNSVDTLSPNNRFVKLINSIPITPGIPYHSIIGDRGKGGNKDHRKPASSDGVVPYWSSHLDGAKSELIVPSGHSAHQSPEAINEVRRILNSYR